MQLTQLNGAYRKEGTAAKWYSFARSLVIFENLTDCCWKNSQLTHSVIKATEQSRAHFIAEGGNSDYNPGHFIYVNKSPNGRLTIRRCMGRSPIGTCASRRDITKQLARAHFGYNILSVISLSGILQLDIFPCAATGNMFNAVIQSVVSVTTRETIRLNVLYRYVKSSRLLSGCSHCTSPSHWDNEHNADQLDQPQELVAGIGINWTICGCVDRYRQSDKHLYD